MISSNLMGLICHNMNHCKQKRISSDNFYTSAFLTTPYSCFAHSLPTSNSWWKQKCNTGADFLKILPAYTQSSWGQWKSPKETVIGFPFFFLRAKQKKEKNKIQTQTKKTSAPRKIFGWGTVELVKQFEWILLGLCINLIQNKEKGKNVEKQKGRGLTCVPVDKTASHGWKSVWTSPMWCCCLSHSFFGSGCVRIVSFTLKKNLKEK